MSSGKHIYEGDQEIFQALKSNQMGAIDQIYKLYRSDFLRVAALKFSAVPKEDLIDAWQDTVISFYEQIRSGKLSTLTCSLRTFLFLLGYRYIIKYKRHYLKELSSDKMENNSNQQVSLIELDWDKPWNEEKKTLEDSIQQLPEQSRRILILRYLEGKTIDEIKTEMNYTSTNVVSATLSRSLNKLREVFTQK